MAQISYEVCMAAKTTQKPTEDPVKQFSVFIENKVGRLMDIISLLDSHNTHVVALTILDTTDSSIVRMIVDDPDRTRVLFQEHAIPHTELDVIAVEMKAVSDLKSTLAVLLQAEINILSSYSFLTRPQGKSALALNVDDQECAVHVLTQNQFKVLHQRDISR